VYNTCIIEGGLEMEQVEHKNEGNYSASPKPVG